MVVAPFLFWSLVFFGSVGFVSLTLAFLFSERGLACRMYDEIEDFFEGVKTLISSIFDLVLFTMIFPFACLISPLIPKRIKKDLLSIGRDSIMKKIISKRIVRSLSNNEIVNLQDQIDGQTLYRKIGHDDSELMERIISNKGYWDSVSRNCSFDIAQRFPTLINWSIFLRVRKLSESELESLSSYIDWDYVGKHQSFSEEFFFEHSNRFDIRYINIDKNPWLRESNQSASVKLYISNL